MATRNLYEGTSVGIDDVVSDYNIDLSDDTEIDSATFQVVPSYIVNIGDEVNFYDIDSNLIFKGLCRNIKIKGENSDVKELTVYSYEVQLQDRIVDDLFENVSPESLIETIVTTYSEMTFSTSYVSGITIPRYRVNNKTAWDVIKDILDKYIGLTYRVTTGKVFTLFETGSIASALNITNGVNAIIQKWEQDISKQVTRLRLYGDKERVEKVQTFSGNSSDVTFTLAEVPENIKVSISGVEKAITVEGQTVGDFTLNRPARKVTFSSAPTTGTDNISILYNFDIPVFIEHEADPQIITDYGIIEKPLTKKFLTTTTDASYWAEKYVDTFGTPILNAPAQVIESLDITGVYPGYSISVVDSYNTFDGATINNTMIIKKVNKSLNNGIVIEVGENRNRLIDYFRENFYNLRQLYEQENNSDLIRKNQTVVNNVRVTITAALEPVILRRYDADTWYWSESDDNTRSDWREDGSGDLFLEDGGYSDLDAYITLLTTEDGFTLQTEDGFDLQK